MRNGEKSSLVTLKSFFAKSFNSVGESDHETRNIVERQMMSDIGRVTFSLSSANLDSPSLISRVLYCVPRPSDVLH